MSRSALVLLFVVLVAGCDSNGSGPSGVGDLFVSLNVVGMDNVQLYIETEETYAQMCPLDVDPDVDGGDANVEVRGIVTSGVCLTAVGPASSAVMLPSRDLVGYEVRLEKDGDTDRYVIRSGIEGLYLEEREASFSRPVNTF